MACATILTSLIPISLLWNEGNSDLIVNLDEIAELERARYPIFYYWETVKHNSEKSSSAWLWLSMVYAPNAVLHALHCILFKPH